MKRTSKNVSTTTDLEDDQLLAVKGGEVPSIWDSISGVGGIRSPRPPTPGVTEPRVEIPQQG